MSEIHNPFAIFLDLRGLALEAGYIYIGVENQDPETNPQATYWDSSLSTLATQPIRTLAGVPDRSGSPGKMFTSGKYSIRVRDSLGVQVYYSASEGDLTGASGQDYIIWGQFLGTPGVDDAIFGHIFDRAVTIPTDMTDANTNFSIQVLTNPGSNCVCPMYLNGASFGTVTITTAGAVTIACNAESPTQNDLLLIRAPGTATTVKDIFFRTHLRTA